MRNAVVSAAIAAAVLGSPIVLSVNAAQAQIMRLPDTQTVSKVPNTSGTTPAQPAASAVPAMQLGMNLGTPSYWSGEWAYAELFKNNADFTFANQLQLPITLDAGGRPTNVAAGTTLFLAVDVTRVWRSGAYDCRISPGWDVSVRFGNTGTIAQTGQQFVLTIGQPSPGVPMHLNFLARTNGATLSELSCRPRMPATSSSAAQTLNPAFVADMKPYRVLRFMDWMKTNNLGAQTWANRPLPGDLSLVPRGASVEDMVALANETGSDPWFTLPFDADDDYYRRFATYVRDRLAPGRKAYVELSNEVWNASFQQGRDAVTRGKQRYSGVYDYQAADYYYGDRVRDVMAIWTQVFAGQTARIVRVAASQLFFTGRAEYVLGHGDTWKSVDALAGAPYFGALVDGIAGSGQARVNAYFAALPGQATQAVDVGVSAKAVADKYKLKFIGYEGGPDLVAYSPAAKADAQAILADPRMHDTYVQFLQSWRTRVGGALVLYNSTGNGLYSHKEYTGQSLADSQKARAIADFAATLSLAK